MTTPWPVVLLGNILQLQRRCIILAYWYEGADVAALARRLRTRESWVLERRHFENWTSDFAEAEPRDGVFARQSDCVKMVRRLRYLPATLDAHRMAEQLTRRGAIPATKPVDAAHVAMSTVHAIDFLLTWNYAHGKSSRAGTVGEALP